VIKLRNENTEFSKYFNGSVDEVTERFLRGENVAYDDIYVEETEELNNGIT